MEKIAIFACIFAFVVVTIQGAAVPAALQEIGNVAHEFCVKETGASNDALKNALGGDFEMLEKDDKTRCYFKCVFEKFELIADDDINFDIMLSIVPEEIQEEGTRVIEACRQITGKDLCEKVMNINKCWQKENPELYFVI